MTTAEIALGEKCLPEYQLRFAGYASWNFLQSQSVGFIERAVNRWNRAGQEQRLVFFLRPVRLNRLIGEDGAID